MALKNAREEKGLSQAAAAARVGVDPMTLSRWERGIRRPPRAATLLLATLYGVAPEVLGEQAGDLDMVPRGTIESQSPAGSVSATGRVSETAPPYTEARHSRNLPHAARVYLADLRVRLTKGGASEEEIDEAMDLLRTPALFVFFKGGHPSELSEEDVLRGMKAIAEGVIIPELRDRGRKIR